MTDLISKKASIGNNVTVGPFTIVHDNVAIGDNSVIESHCVVGYPSKFAQGKRLVVGENSYIRSHSILYEGSQFGSNLATGHAVLVRENCQAGKYLQIGSHSEIEGDCTIGDYVKIHSKVNIAKETNVGNFVWLYPQVQFTNDPLPPSNTRAGVTVKDMVVIATGALLLPGITIGMGCFVAAGSVVYSDVRDIQCVAGNPAKKFASLDRFFSLKYGISPPWPKYFRKGYPAESYPTMDAIVEKINRLIDKNKRIAIEQSNIVT